MGMVCGMRTGVKVTIAISIILLVLGIVLFRTSFLSDCSGSGPGIINIDDSKGQVSAIQTQWEEKIKSITISWDAEFPVDVFITKRNTALVPDNSDSGFHKLEYINTTYGEKILEDFEAGDIIYIRVENSYYSHNDHEIHTEIDCFLLKTKSFVLFFSISIILIFIGISLLILSIIMIRKQKKEEVMEPIEVDEVL